MRTKFALNFHTNRREFFYLRVTFWRSFVDRLLNRIRFLLFVFTVQVLRVTLNVVLLNSNHKRLGCVSVEKLMKCVFVIVIVSIVICSNSPNKQPANGKFIRAPVATFRFSIFRGVCVAIIVLYFETGI